MFNIKKVISVFLLLLMLLNMFSMSIFAENGKINVVGKIYSFDKNSNYEFSASKDFTSSDKADTYGDFFVSGDIANISTKDGVPSYEIKSGNLQLFYTYGDSKLNAAETSWHLVDDNDKEVDGKKLNNKIKKGAILLQTSKDRKNWIDSTCQTNIFSEVPVQTESLYSTQDVEILNGCFYRLIVVYQTERVIGTNKVLFVTVKDYEEKKTAEIYEFFAYSENGTANKTPEQTYRLGEKVRTEKFDGYSGQTDITQKKDAHYGWDIGHFYVSGFTSDCNDTDNNKVFLKNVGDKITLWFSLEQNINAIQGDSNITITADEEGHDEYFETPTMNFGRGTLIVRHTDYQGNKSEPQIYTNYLEANATLGADTIVQLFEEGDYEVALDYEVTNNKIIDSVGHYRIFFKFAVRNGNCMVYPFDVANGNELTNSSMTDNGFRLDLAKSRYLKVNIKREILTDSADGLIEDTRFNSPAKDGAKYTEEGIYTITVQNQYTNQFTTKKIYVGTNNVLKAHMTTGLPVSEINNLVATGATISDDGIITLSTNSTVIEISTEVESESIAIDSNNQESYDVLFAIIIIIASLLIACVIIVIVVKKRKKATTNQTNEEGVVEQ